MADYGQRKSNMNKVKGFYYIEITGKHPDCFQVYIEKAFFSQIIKET